MADPVSVLFERIAEHIEASGERCLASRRGKELSDLLVSISRDRIAFSKGQITLRRLQQRSLYNSADILRSSDGQALGA